MKMYRVVTDNPFLSFFMGGLVLSLGVVVVGFVFFLGTQWGLYRSGPDISPGIAIGTPVPERLDTVAPSQTPNILPTQTAVMDLTSTAVSEPLELTSTPSASVTPVSTRQPSDWAKLVSFSPKDGAYFGPNTTFKKTWTVKNVGTTTWNTDFDLVFFSGIRMLDKKVVALTEKVKPGQTIDISLRLVTPKKPGVYEGYWMLRNRDGDLFGIGPEADQALKVKITVLNVDPASRYDFLIDRCSAVWWNGRGESLNCPGEPNATAGFVLLDPEPVLENGSPEKPILWVHTENRSEGSISGKYPSIQIKEGEHVKAKVGCISGYTKCNLTFKLLYQIGQNSPKSLGSWKELYGGGVTNIDVDLSHLAGQKVQFILRAVCTNNTPSNAHGFWMTPRIIYIEPSPTPTSSPTINPTATPTQTAAPSETPVSEPTPTGAPGE